MKTKIGLERCHAFINCQLQPPSEPAPGLPAAKRAVTISRQSGAGGHVVAAKLADLLQANESNGGRPWTVFDKNLVEKVLEDHHLPKRLAQFMPEDRTSELTDTIDEIFGLHPPSWTLVRQAADTIFRLAELGNVILIGRGANLITQKLDYAVHARLVAPFERRVEYIAELEHLPSKAAAEFVRREDSGRRRYVKKYFDREVDDPLLYHLVINTDLVGYDAAARLIAEAVTGGAGG